VGKNKWLSLEEREKKVETSQHLEDKKATIRSNSGQKLTCSLRKKKRGMGQGRTKGEKSITVSSEFAAARWITGENWISGEKWGSLEK